MIPTHPTGVYSGSSRREESIDVGSVQIAPTADALGPKTKNFDDDPGEFWTLKQNP